MSSAPSSPWRAARSAVASVGSATVAMTVHRASGGSIDPLFAAGVIAVAAGISWPLSRRRFSVARIVGLLVLCQAAVHSLAASDHLAVGGTAMLAGHAVATALTAVVLARGEQWAWFLAEALALRPWRNLRVVTLPEFFESTIVDAPIRGESRRRWRPALSRGPPAVT